MAEFALAVPILLGVIFFIIEFGNVLYLSNSLNIVARAAARYASMNPDATVNDLVTASGASASFASTADLTLNVSPSPSASRSVGDALTVEAQWSYTPFVNPFHFFSQSTTWSPTIKGYAISRVEVAD